MNRSTISVLAVLSFAGSAFADDLFPAPWRFNAGTTVQHWNFSSGPAGGAPDALPLLNPYGTPMCTPTFGAAWSPLINGRPDVFLVSSNTALTFDVPNTGNSAHMKDLWLQVTYFAPAPSPAPGYTVASATTGPFTFISSQLTALPGGWIHELTKWSTPICPPFERVSIFPSVPGSSVFIDQVVIDTQCIPVPAPSAMATLALGGLAAFRRRRN